MMNNEEIERKMNFIVEQQAQFASDIQQLQESQMRTEQIVAQTSKTVAQTAGTVAQMEDVVIRLANVTHVGFTEVNGKLNALVDAQIRTEAELSALADAQISTEAKVSALADAQISTEANIARTNENLTNFIAVVDRRFREDRNGK